MTLMGDEPELHLGDSGDHVAQLQDRLRGLGLLDKQPDGTYDDSTEYAVRQLQSTLGHDNDGAVGSETWPALDQYMLSQGLTYDHYSGAGNQHWDQQALPAASEGWPPDGGPWDETGTAHQQWDETSAASEPVQIPHIDNVHPAIKNSDQFPTFQEFLRNNGG